MFRCPAAALSTNWIRQWEKRYPGDPAERYASRILPWSAEGERLAGSAGARPADIRPMRISISAPSAEKDSAGIDAGARKSEAAPGFILFIPVCKQKLITTGMQDRIRSHGFRM